MSSYPDMTVEQAIKHEEGLPIEEVNEFIDFDQSELTTEVRIVE
jgi:hypothetical protein